MNTYADEFSRALERSRRFGLDTPHVEPQTDRRWLDEKASMEFPYVVQKALGNLELEEVVAQCMQIHYRLVDAVSTWLGCPAYFTIGWVDDMTPGGMFRFDEDFIAEKLLSGHQASTIAIHAWLTLPSMEVIDLALPTSLGHFQNNPALLGRVIAKHVDEMQGMSYKPMLVGEDFLRKIGLLHEGTILIM